MTVKKALIYPGWDDPRWLQLGFLLSFVCFALSAPSFGRTPVQFAAGMAACLLLDSALIYFYRGLLLLPVSGLITSMGLLLLVDTASLWPYPLVGALAILSKHLIRIDGKHIFNPLNFGIMAALIFLPGEVTVVSGRWGGSLASLLIVACLGTYVVYRAKRLDLAVAYTLTFVAGSVFRHNWYGTPYSPLLGPMTGAAFQLYIFFMISDPMATPESPRGRWIFGLALGLIDLVLRVRGNIHAPLYALFILSGTLPVFRRLFAPASPERIWKTRQIPVWGNS